VYEIRPLRTGEVLDRALRIVRDHAGLLVGTALLPYAPMAVLEELTRGMDDPAAMSRTTAALVLGSIALATVLMPIASGAITVAVARVHRGDAPGMGEAYRESLALALPLVGTSILASLAVLLGAVALVLPGIYLGVGLLVVTPVVVLERSAGTAAMGRSLHLLRGRMWGALGLLALWTAVFVPASLAVTLGLGQVPVLGPLANALVQSLALAVYGSLTTVLYLDAACRKEGIDDAHLAQLLAPLSPPLR